MRTPSVSCRLRPRPVDITPLFRHRPALLREPATPCIGVHIYKGARTMMAASHLLAIETWITKAAPVSSSPLARLRSGCGRGRRVHSRRGAIDIKCRPVAPCSDPRSGLTHLACLDHSKAFQETYSRH